MKWGIFQSKNPKFFPCPRETWSKQLSHEIVVLTKFHDNRAKIVAFFINSQFL